MNKVKIAMWVITIGAAISMYFHPNLYSLGVMFFGFLFAAGLTLIDEDKYFN